MGDQPAGIPGGVNQPGSFILYFLQERFPELEGNAAAGPTAMLVMFVGVAILISSIPAGWLTDKFGRKPLCAFSGVLALLGTIVVIASTGMTMLYIGGLMIGIAIGIFYSASWSMGTAMVPKAEAGAISVFRTWPAPALARSAHTLAARSATRQALLS